MARIRSAHSQINSEGVENLSDQMLAYAMTIALPESFATLKQTMWLRSPLTSAEVAGGVSAEWARRRAGEASGALFARQRFRNNNNKGRGDKGRMYGPDKNAYCTEHKAYGHHTKDCHRVNGRTKSNANPAISNSTTFPQM